MTGKVWQKRFEGPLDPRVHSLNRSIAFDQRLGPYDVQVSLVWAKALRKADVLKDEELAALRKGLEKIGQEFQEGEFEFTDEDEDVHMAIERRLGEVIGDAAQQLHFGRSRNDQVATDLRLFAMDHSRRIRSALLNVVRVLVDMSENHAGTPFPGHTHLQQAQVISLGQLLLAHAGSLRSDATFLALIQEATGMCPLGSAALGGSPAPVDREWIAQELGFSRPSANSVEAVASRDFVIDLLYGLSRLGLHLSRLAEDFILWNSQEFGFVILDDTAATGSSQLAHKKNPDVFELLRGKCGRLVGNLMGFMTVLKGLPAGYNKDLQEDKEPLFDSVDNVLQVLPALQAALENVTFQIPVIAGKLSPYLKAERIVHYLVGKGVPFREAYGIAGQLVKEAEQRGVLLEELPVEFMKEAAAVLEKDIVPKLKAGWEIPAAGVMGGSSRESLRQQIKTLRGWLEDEVSRLE